MYHLVSLSVSTPDKESIVEITAQVEAVIRDSGVEHGLCTVFTPHTTCGVTLNEHADPAVSRDLLYALNLIVPREGAYAHQEGNSPAHVKASLIGSSQSIPICNSRLCLGRWQGIFLCEFDGPRQRTFLVEICGER
ncbi:MAG TPA: YjbQ family protein [Firmicutes bacterium]|nr:YjbQ family protein [Bacillota bacterium]